MFKFKPLTFVLPTPNDIVIPKNHLTSPPSSLEFPYSLPKNNLFSLSKTTPTCLDKGNPFTSTFSPSFSSIPTITVFPALTLLPLLLHYYCRRCATTTVVAHATDDAVFAVTTEAATISREVNDRVVAPTAQNRRFLYQTFVIVAAPSPLVVVAAVHPVNAVAVTITVDVGYVATEIKETNDYRRCIIVRMC